MAGKAETSGAMQFEVTVAGTYYAGTRGNKIQRPYTNEVFVLPTLNNAQHTIYRKLISQRLMAKYPDFVAVRTCEIVNTAPTTRTAAQAAVVDVPISEMSLAQLTQFAIAQDLAVDPTKCGSVMAARKAVSDAMDDKHLLNRQRAEGQAQRKREQEEKDVANTLAQAPVDADMDKPSAEDDDPLAALE